MNLQFRDSAASQDAGITYHMAIASEWLTQKHASTYTPSAFATDGFIHCTNGLDALTWVGNQFYKNSPDERVVLVLEVGKLASPVRYDDAEQRFPHVYGPINTDAVVGELPVIRGTDGSFARIGGG